LGEALSRASSTGERWFEAELHRLTGECLLDRDRAEASFSRALEIARAQSAKMWELRAASSLARLWQSQGRHEEARDLIAPVYGWFSEGFDTPDLQAAKCLLAEGADPRQDRRRVRRRTGRDLSPTT
jgi:predicted ATPase